MRDSNQVLAVLLKRCQRLQERAERLIPSECRHQTRVRFGYSQSGRWQDCKRYRCVICGATFAAGNPLQLPGHYLSLDKFRRLLTAIAEGATAREAARLAGTTKNTAFYIARQFPNRRCPCGDPVGHRGWCAWRYARHPKRQRTLKRMHAEQARRLPTAIKNFDRLLASYAANYPNPTTR